MLSQSPPQTPSLIVSQVSLCSDGVCLCVSWRCSYAEWLWMEGRDLAFKANFLSLAFPKSPTFKKKKSYVIVIICKNTITFSTSKIKVIFHCPHKSLLLFPFLLFITPSFPWLTNSRWIKSSITLHFWFNILFHSEICKNTQEWSCIRHFGPNYSTNYTRTML